MVANWLIGREIVEEEQSGARKAGYSEAVLEGLTEKLTADYSAGYSATNLRWFRQYYLEYRSLLPREIHHGVRDKSTLFHLQRPQEFITQCVGVMIYGPDETREERLQQEN